jgi:steroid 5-alpha reductase family enzyme
MDFATSHFLWGMLASAGAILVVMLATFALALRLGRHSVIDTVWGLGFVVVAAVSFGLSSGHGASSRRLLVLVIIAVWGIRLATHIGMRARGKGEDRRYVDMLAKAPGNKNLYALKIVYLAQGVTMWWVSLPAQLAMYEGRSLGALAIVGALVAVVGIGFESLGDYQLTTFLADSSNRNKVMDRGLWRYTRHPNYFGDACLWWGVFLIAAEHFPGVFTILSPIAMTILLVQGTGKALLEKTMGERRPGYAEYVKRTSGFLPLPPKKS